MIGLWMTIVPFRLLNLMFRPPSARNGDEWCAHVQLRITDEGNTTQNDIHSHTEVQYVLYLILRFCSNAEPMSFSVLRIISIYGSTVHGEKEHGKNRQK